MCDDNSSSSVASDVECLESEFSYSRDPPYTPQALADIFLDFYRFLATLHFNPADLKIAPPEGWPGISREIYPNWKSDYALEVIRRLPYFRSKAAVHYKCRLIDYTSFNPKELPQLDELLEDKEFWDDEGIVDPAHVICIASGFESFGRMLFLDVQSGMITEELIRADILPPQDIQDYFNELKDTYRSLKIIPCVGRITIKANRVPERNHSLDVITQDQVCAQEEEWGTELDIHYVRQLYRQYGWPDDFRRDEARMVLDELMSRIEEKRWVWEPEDGEIWMWRQVLE